MADGQDQTRIKLLFDTKCKVIDDEMTLHGVYTNKEIDKYAVYLPKRGAPDSFVDVRGNRKVEIGYVMLNENKNRR